MPLYEWCQWLQHTRFATAITESDWLFPLLEGSHILALPISVGMILIADLRLLGLAFCGEAAGKIVPSFLRLSRLGFPVMFLTGGLLLITQAGKAYGNPFFRAKLIFLVLLATNAALYQSDPAARKPVDYLRDEFDNQTGRLSLDGRFIAYRSDESKPERYEVYVRPFDAAKPMDEKKWQVSKDGVVAFSITDPLLRLPLLHWRGDGKEIFFRGQELDSEDLVMMAAEVQTTPTFKVDAPRVLFRVPGPVQDSLGAVSRDGQRFVVAVNVPADKTEHSSSGQ